VLLELPDGRIAKTGKPCVLVDPKTLGELLDGYDRMKHLESNNQEQSRFASKPDVDFDDREIYDDLNAAKHYILEFWQRQWDIEHGESPAS